MGPLPNSSAQTGDYIMVHFLQFQSAGSHFRRRRNDWPLHITLVPWFTVPDAARLESLLCDFVEQEQSFQVILGDEEQFNSSTRVTLVTENTSLSNLHRGLLALVHQADSKPRNMQWTGGTYRPHVTHHAQQPIPQTGTILEIETFSLVQLVAGNICQVEQNYILGTVI